MDDFWCIFWTIFLYAYIYIYIYTRGAAAPPQARSAARRAPRAARPESARARQMGHPMDEAPRAPPKWEAAEAADWFKLVQEAVQR